MILIETFACTKSCLAELVEGVHTWAVKSAESFLWLLLFSLVAISRICHLARECLLPIARLRAPHEQDFSSLGRFVPSGGFKKYYLSFSCTFF